jgi:hypothetical protein
VIVELVGQFTQFSRSFIGVAQSKPADGRRHIVRMRPGDFGSQISGFGFQISGIGFRKSVPPLPSGGRGLG